MTKAELRKWLDEDHSPEESQRYIELATMLLSSGKIRLEQTNGVVEELHNLWYQLASHEKVKANEILKEVRLAERARERRSHCPSA